MFQAAVGRPMPEIGFDGKLMLRQICCEYKALEDSVNHKKGDRYDKYENYNGAMHIISLSNSFCNASQSSLSMFCLRGQL